MLDHLMWMIGANSLDTRKDYSLFGGVGDLCTPSTANRCLAGCRVMELAGPVRLCHKTAVPPQREGTIFTFGNDRQLSQAQHWAIGRNLCFRITSYSFPNLPFSCT